MSEIGNAVRELERERRNKMRELMDQWDREYYYPKLKELRDQCDHNWIFSGTNPVGYPIFDCTICHKCEIRSDE